VLVDQVFPILLDEHMELLVDAKYKKNATSINKINSLLFLNVDHLVLMLIIHCIPFVKLSTLHAKPFELNNKRY
jgi:hypothetical protein